MSPAALDRLVHEYDRLDLPAVMRRVPRARFYEILNDFLARLEAGELIWR